MRTARYGSANELRKQAADEPVDLVRLRRGGRAPRSRWPRPARRRRPARRPGRGEARESAAHLAADDLPHRAGFALREGFAHADDRQQPVAQGGERLAVDVLVRLAKSWRRSLWPMMTAEQPASFSRLPETSPVNAPFSSQWESCAATRIGLPARAAATGASAVKTGATITARSSPPTQPARSSSASAVASAIVRCIFQFPARIGMRVLTASPSGPRCRGAVSPP